MKNPELQTNWYLFRVTRPREEMYPTLAIAGETFDRYFSEGTISEEQHSKLIADIESLQ